MKDTIVVDVRTPGEFAVGHVAGSVNIPLDEVPRRLNEFGAMRNIVLCCASGGRSHNAWAYLKQNGIASLDGGAWTNVNYHLNNN